MITVDDARGAIVSAIGALPAETVPIGRAAGRALAAPAVARLSQSPFDASAMDGYAVRHSECAPGARLKVIGESAAGKRFDGALASGTAVRIFTGAPVPAGADHILIQEDAERVGDVVIVRSPQARAEHVRSAGMDFGRGDILAPAGAIVSGVLPALIAAGNIDEVAVRRQPRVALIANGDELAFPGPKLGRDDIVCSIPFGLAPLIDNWGASAVFLGVARDNARDIAALIDQARDFDLIVPIGGASVGDRDLMRAAFEAKGFSPLFQKVAMKPGKPAWFGRLGDSFVLGLPGNPASAFLTARLFVRTAIRAFLGQPAGEDYLPARTGADLPPNGPRETYLRAALSRDGAGAPIVTPFANQDSSLLSVLARSDVLIRRRIDAPPCRAGAVVECLRLW